MKLAELKKLMPDATDDILKANLKIINDDAQTQVDSEVKGLKDNKTKLLDQMSTLKKNQLPDDFDSEGYTTYKKDKKEFDKKKKELDDAELEGKGQWEALKLKLNETNATALTTLTGEKDAKISGLQFALDKEMIDNVSLKAIGSEKGNALFLMPHMQGNMKNVQAEDGSYGIQVVDIEGNQRFAEDATTPFTVSDLVAEFKANPKFAAAFPEQNAGGGANPNAGGSGGAGINPWKTETKNITAQAKMNMENPTLAAQMKKAAGIAA